MENFDEKNDDGKSRSQKKRESTAVQKLGEALAALGEGDLKKLDVPPDLAEALRDWRNFPGHEAKRRQMQYIGRLMRDTDTDALQEKLDAFRAPGRDEKALLHRVEALREKLCSLEGEALDAALADVAARHHSAPAAKLRHLVVAAQDEKRKKRPPKAYRELFRLLKDCLETDGTV